MNDAAAQLLRVLVDERRALLNGDLAILSAKAEKKLALLETIGDLSQSDLDLVRDNLLRNFALLSCAAQGIKSASDRFLDVCRLRNGFDAYSNSGALQKIGGLHSKLLERRA